MAESRPTVAGWLLDAVLMPCYVRSFNNLPWPWYSCTVAPFGRFLILGFLKIGDPQVTMGFNTVAWSNDLDDLGVAPF